MVLFNLSEYFALKLFGNAFSAPGAPAWVAHLYLHLKNKIQIIFSKLYPARFIAPARATDNQILYKRSKESLYNKPFKSASAGGTGLSMSQKDDTDSRQSSPGITISPENVDKYFFMETASFMKIFDQENKKIAEMFKKISDANVSYSDKTHDIYFTLLKGHANALNISYSNRDG